MFMCRSFDDQASDSTDFPKDVMYYIRSCMSQPSASLSNAINNYYLLL